MPASCRRAPFSRRSRSVEADDIDRYGRMVLAGYPGGGYPVRRFALEATGAVLLLTADGSVLARFAATDLAGAIAAYYEVFPAAVWSDRDLRRDLDSRSRRHNRSWANDGRAAGSAGVLDGGESVKDVGRIPESEASFDRCTEETLRGIAELRAIAAAMRARRKNQNPTVARLFRPSTGLNARDDGGGSGTLSVESDRKSQQYQPRSPVGD